MYVIKTSRKNVISISFSARVLQHCPNKTKKNVLTTPMQTFQRNTKKKTKKQHNKRKKSGLKGGFSIWFENQRESHAQGLKHRQTDRQEREREKSPDGKRKKSVRAKVVCCCGMGKEERREGGEAFT